MTPEVAAYLGKARACLEKAAGMLAQWPDEAGRAAYLAALHAAQALIFERTGRVVMTHKGVHRELSRLPQDEPGLEPGLRAFLGRGYELKAIADDETGPDATVTPAQATDAIGTAGRFVAAIVALLPP